MLFNSIAFLLFFLPVCCVGYQIAAQFGRRSAIGWLALASVIFYAWWDWRFIFVLLGSMLLNFCVSLMIAATRAPQSKKAWMIAGVAADLAILCWFKYLFHILRFLTSIGVGNHSWVDPLLPLGISFFTFTQIGYLIDLSEGQAKPQNIIEYTLFVTFFPHLIAGPIIHHKEMMPQFLEKRDPRLNMDDMLTGLSWFVLGLAKKCLFADNLAPLAEGAFNLPHHLGLFEAWAGLLAYSLQLYFDFSGYSDMAIGLARMFSIRFPLNFNSPYKAINVIEFWQRWHMTLTRYLTLYLYNPIALAVNRRRFRLGQKVSPKAARTPSGFLSMIAWPTMTTMIVVGVWHGAGLQFLIFGVLHGFYLTVNHAWRLYRGEAALREQPAAIKRLGCVLLTYLCVLVGQIFFRAAGTGDAFNFLASMMGRHGYGPHVPLSTIALVSAGLAIVWGTPNTQEILGQEGFTVKTRLWLVLQWKPNLASSLMLGILFAISLLYIGGSATFLYFQF